MENTMTTTEAIQNQNELYAEFIECYNHLSEESKHAFHKTAEFLKENPKATLQETQEFFSVEKQKYLAGLK